MYLNIDLSVFDLLVARRVTLVVAFEFLHQNFGRWWEPMNAILPFFDCRLSGNTQSGGDTQTPPDVIENIEILHSEVVER